MTPHTWFPAPNLSSSYHLSVAYLLLKSCQLFKYSMCKHELIHSAGLLEWLLCAKCYVVNEMQTSRNLVGKRWGYIIVMQFDMINRRGMRLGVQGEQRGRSPCHLSRTSEGRCLVKWVMGVGGWWRGRKEWSLQTRICSTQHRVECRKYLDKLFFFPLWICGNVPFF